MRRSKNTDFKWSIVLFMAEFNLIWVKRKIGYYLEMVWCSNAKDMIRKWYQTKHVQKLTFQYIALIGSIFAIDIDSEDKTNKETRKTFGISSKLYGMFLIHFLYSFMILYVRSWLPFSNVIFLQFFAPSLYYYASITQISSPSLCSISISFS